MSLPHRRSYGCRTVDPAPHVADPERIDASFDKGVLGTSAWSRPLGRARSRSRPRADERGDDAPVIRSPTSAGSRG
jgi:hypothetical protein